MKHVAALVAVLVLSPVAAADKKPYTLADLEALVAHKSYPEAVAHLSDIAPSERTADWLAVATDAATGYIGGLSNDNLVTKVFAIEELDQAYPAILKSPKYTKVRAAIGLAAYEGCFRESYTLDECMKHAARFVEADAGNWKLALDVAKAVRRSGFAYNAVPHFRRALTGKANATVCKDDDLKLAVIAGLALPNDSDGARGALTIAGGTCWDSLGKDIVKAFDDEGESGYIHDNACDLLKSKKVLNATQARTCDKKKK
jgi:hypothetical protein